MLEGAFFIGGIIIESLVFPTILVAIAVFVVFFFAGDGVKVRAFGTAAGEDDDSRVIIEFEGLLDVGGKGRIFNADRGSYAGIIGLEGGVDFEAFIGQRDGETDATRSTLHAILRTAEDRNSLITKERKGAIVFEQNVAFSGELNVKLIGGFLRFCEGGVVSGENTLIIQVDCTGGDGVRNRSTHAKRHGAKSGTGEDEKRFFAVFRFLRKH